MHEGAQGSPWSTTLEYTDTVIHRTQELKKPIAKPLAKALRFFSPHPLKHEGDRGAEAHSSSNRILDALSQAGLRRRPCGSPREIPTTVDVVDGKSGAIIRPKVPVFWLLEYSQRARGVLEPMSRAGQFKVYGKYKMAAMCAVLEAITWGRYIPVSGTIIMHNLFTYEACLRLGIHSDRKELKPLLAAINNDLSKQPIDSELMVFIANHLGPNDRVFMHMAHVLCHERYNKSVLFSKETARSVATTPAVQKACWQIDRSHEIGRRAMKKRQQARSGSDEEKVADNVGTSLGNIAKEKTDYERERTLLRLFKDNEKVRLDANTTKDVKGKDETKMLE